MTGGAGCNSMEPGKRCPGMTETEYRTEFSLWTIGAASMIVSTVRTRLVCVVLFPQKPNVYQDRLGTNKRKLRTNRRFYPQDLRDMSDFMKATLMNKEMLAIHQDSFGISGGLCVPPWSPRSHGRPVLMVAPFFQGRTLQNLLFHLACVD